MAGGFNPLEGWGKPKPAPKKKAAPKKAPAPSAADRAVVRAARTVGTTTKAAAPTVTRAVTRTVRSVPKNVAADAARVRALEDAILSGADRTGAQPARPRPETGGPNDLQRLLGATGGGRTIGGFVRNYAKGAVDTLVSVPAQAQLVGEALLYGASAGVNAATGNGGLGFGNGNRNDQASQTFRQIERRTGGDLRAAGTAVKKDYAYRYGPLVKGDVGEFGARFYDDPFPTVADAFGVKSIIGRSPNVALRAVRSIAPESAAGMRAARALSALSAAERVNLSRATGHPILEGAGGRYRPPRRTVSSVARAEDGLPETGVSVRMIPQRAYSGDATARLRQKAVDRFRNTTVPKIEVKAESLVLPARRPGARKAGPIRQAVSTVASKVTAQAKYDRAITRETRGIMDLADAQAEVAIARSRGVGKSAIAKLKPVKTRTIELAEGNRAVSSAEQAAGLSVEEAAFALRSRDILDSSGGRGGLTNVQLRDLYVQNMERGQRVARSRGARTERAAAQLEVIKAIPDEMLMGNDLKIPAVRRINAAVDEARRLNANAQLRAIEAGVVKPKTVAEAATRDSGIALAGVEWGRDVIAKVNRDYQFRSRALKKRIEAAKEAGDTVTAKRLTAQLGEASARRRMKIEAIREDATRITPEIQKARAEFHAAKAKLADEQSRVATKSRLAQMYSAGRIAGRGERNVELAPRMRGRRHQPGVPTKGKDFIPEERGPKQPWQEYRARKFSRELAPNAKEGQVPHPPVAPGFQRKGITAGEAKAYRTVLRGQAKRYKVRLKTQGASGSKISAGTRARDVHFRRLRKLEDEALGFTSPKRPELVGQRGVYTPDRFLDQRAGYTGPRPGGRLSGPDQARRSEGRLKSTGNIDMSPELILHQHARSMQNYTGRISAKALDELIATAKYVDPATGKTLTGSRQALLAAVESGRARLVNVGNLRKALAKLDDLENGKFLDDGSVRDVFPDTIPEGAMASDYVAISEAAARVWTEHMTKVPYFDAGMNWWKGGLLALSPRWYVNNTFGLALQYGLMTGLDIRSVMQASNGAFRKSIAARLEKMYPNVSRRLASSGERKSRVARAMESRQPNLVRDTMATELVGNDVPRVMAFGFHINNKFEAFWRRASANNRTKQALRQEGVKIRKLDEAQMARLIEDMPESMIRNIVSDVEYFIGDYRKFSNFEREILKRAIPFYSWLRVIARLTFGLPLRSPVRTAAMALLETASTAGINPNDKMLAPYERGALRIMDKAIPTWGLNPWQTLSPVLEAAGEPSPLGAISKEAIGWINPVAQFLISQATGTNSFGQGVSAAPWEAAFGGDAPGFNTVTGLPTRQKASIGFKDALVSAAFPGQVSVIRRVAAGGRSPYDTTSNEALVGDWMSRTFGDGKRDESLYKPQSKRAGRVAAPQNTWSTIFGVPVYNQDDAALVREAEKRMREAAKELRRMNRKRERAKR